MLQVFSYENIQTGVKGGLNHKMRQDVSKLNRKNYHLHKRSCSINEYE